MTKRMKLLETRRLDRKELYMATLDAIKEILEETLDINPEDVTDEATFEDLGIDSLDMAELICDIEEKLDIDFGEPEDLETIEDLVSYIDSL